jgi:hypothetical protein
VEITAASIRPPRSRSPLPRLSRRIPGTSRSGYAHRYSRSAQYGYGYSPSRSSVTSYVMSPATSIAIPAANISRGARCSGRLRRIPKNAIRTEETPIVLT